MAFASPLAGTARWAPVEVNELRGVVVPVRFGEPADELRAAMSGSVIADRAERTTIVLRGADRLSWLQNVVTNDVRSLAPGEVRYAFALDVRGRIQFDLHVIADAECAYVDVDRAACTVALAHFDRYLFTEKVALEDGSSRLARLALIGPGAEATAAAIAPLGMACRFASGFVGAPATELIVPIDRVGEVWSAALDSGATPIGRAALDALRIRGGVPWFGWDIDAGVLPAETGQLDRAVSFHKGCYVGQEVVERMRSHGALAKQLVRVTLSDGVPTPALLRSGNVEAGRITSACRDPIDGGWIGLGYLRKALWDAGDLTAGDPPVAVRVTSAAEAG